MKKLLYLLVLLLAGCSAPSAETIEVTIKASEQEVEAFEPVKITSHVTLNNESISSGVEIEFELINPDGTSIGTVTPTNEGEGLYSIETSFDGQGTYKIISHVSYGELHEMPEVEVTLK
ncbi:MULTISPECIES: FixH family protein [Solibacillus]|uniref:FixH family protein n=1 Tax=Solibacillus faecavium TaxID=2762221 RepID=A0ABR8XVM1_9BACL|nr:FixH family protein [Solibacillus faecavium]MBD8035889.1 FixH family protein [Solibacillus faecavium]